MEAWRQQVRLVMLQVTVPARDRRGILISPPEQLRRPAAVVAARCHEKILPNCWMSLNYPTPLVGASRDTLLTSSNPLKIYIWKNPFRGSSQSVTHVSDGR